MKLVILFLLTLLYSELMAQDKIVVLQMGVGTYAMSTQKEFQLEYQNKNRIPYKAVYKFPPYYSYGVSAGMKLTNVSTAGLWFNYTSTGGTLNYRDYSGYSRVDQLLKCYQYGAFYQYKLTGNEPWSLFASAYGSAIFSSASFKNELVLGTDVQSTATVFKSINFGLQPGLVLQRQLKTIVLQASLGYEFQLHGQLKTRDGFELTTPLGRKVTAEWDGIRASMGVGINIKPKK